MDDNDRRVLQLGDTYFAYHAAKMSAALATTGYTESAFWARFQWLIDQADVEREYPAVCRRGRALRERRRRVRSSVHAVHKDRSGKG